MFRIKGLLILILTTIVTFTALGQDVSFTSSASRTKVGVGEQFQLSFTLNTSGSNFKAPSLSDFDVYAGPNQSTSMQFINGNMSQSVSISFIIAAKKEGKHTIAPASITVNGKKYETKPLTIEVSKSSQPHQQQHQQAQSGGMQQSNTGGSDLGDDLFLKLSVNKTKAFVGEQLIATYKIYTRVNIIDNGISQNPSFTGFWAEDITPKSKQVEMYTENYEGVTYQVADIKKMILFPQRSGTLELDPMEMEFIVRQRVAPRSQSIFDQFFGGGYQDVKVITRTKPVKIQCLSLPEQGKPDNYNGAVGNFTISSKLNKNKVKTNEAITYTFTVSGKGNLKLMDPVKPQLPADIETYDPKITDNITANAQGLSGSRTYEFLMIPRHSGEFLIDAQEFSYFNPETKKYITLKTGEFPITVEKGDDPEPAVFSPSAKEDIKVVGSDIRFIKTSTEFEEIAGPFYGSGAFYSFLAVPLLLFGAVLFGRKKHLKERSDAVSFKGKRANKIARKRLTEAEQHLKQKNYNAFYEEVHKALTIYLTDKMNIPFSGLSKDAIASSLEARGTNSETIKKVIELLDKCEFARFAPLKDVDGMEQVYSDALLVISKIEEEAR